MLKLKSENLKKIIIFFRRLLDCRPRLGDEVQGPLDYGVSFSGIVVEDNSRSELFPTYTVDGYIYYTKDWTSTLIEEKINEIVVPASRAYLVPFF